MKSAVKKGTRTLTTDNADTTDKERKSTYICEISGVMTDNKMYVDQNGIDIVQVNRADGLGIAELKKWVYDKSLFQRKRIQSSL